MKIKELFERDIFRNINPAVVVSDDRPETIAPEINEYIFSPTLIENIYEVLDTILNKKIGKSGIWINGYYGSGKSHFIKFIHYLVDEKTTAIAFEVFLKAVEKYDPMLPGAKSEITMSNVILLQNKIGTSTCDNSMFNIKDESDDGDLKGIITRIFMNMFNKLRGLNSSNIPLANLLEKQLIKKGVFEDFKMKINDELGFDWNIDAADVASVQLTDVLNIAKEFYPGLDVDSMHNTLSNTEAYKVSISDTLIKQITEFLKEKDDSYRLIFLIDEVSQYIGTHKDMLLNLQSVVEQVSTTCDNKVWIACTAQQSLEELSTGVDGVNDPKDEFGKILGRFDTRISLESTDASYITQRRVLDKNSKGVGALEKIYVENKDFIENQFKINHELYKGFLSDEEFILSYPFVPYQFKLIASVFDAFQQLDYVIKEVKDNERSILGITHHTTKDHAENEIGGFITFSDFYNTQFQKNLTHRGTKAIENAFSIPYVKNNEFAQKVVKVLFMISNLLEKERQTFPSNVDNLTVLLMDKLDQNKKQLQKSIQEVLDKLIEGSIIREGEDKGSYFFFNEDEMDVQNLIKSQVIGMEDRWIEFKDIIFPLLRITPKVNFGQNTFKVACSIGSKDFLSKGDFSIKILLSDQTDIAQKALEVAKTDLVICINEWYTADSSLKNNFEWYCKTNKYFKSNSGGSGERSKTNENFKLRNRVIRDSIKATVEAKFSETRFISQNEIIEANEISGVKSNERFDNLVKKHLGGIYKMHELCNEYAKNQAELKASASDSQIPAPILTPAEESVNTMITNNNGQMTVHDLITNYAKVPFGWKHEAVLDVLIQLVKKKKREFQYKGQPRFAIVDFINKAVSTAERMSCEVITGEDIDQTILDNTVQSYNTIFNDKMAVATDGNELFEALINSVNGRISDFQALETKYRTYPFGAPFMESVSLLSTWTNNRDPKKLFDEITEGESATKELVDKTRKIGDYLVRTFEEYKTIKVFYESSNENFKELSQDDQDKGELLKAFLQEEDITTQFRHAKKAYEELKSAIDKYLKDLKEEVTTIYKKVFTFLENEAATRSCPRNCFANKDASLDAIKSLGSITSLKNKKLSVDIFKSEELAKILAAVPGPKVETKEYKVAQGTSMIKSQEELDQFITKAKDDMEKILAENKTIIIK